MNQKHDNNNNDDDDDDNEAQMSIAKTDSSGEPPVFQRRRWFWRAVTVPVRRLYHGLMTPFSRRRRNNPANHNPNEQKIEQVMQLQQPQQEGVSSTTKPPAPTMDDAFPPKDFSLSAVTPYETSKATTTKTNENLDTTETVIHVPAVDLSGDWDLIVTEDFKNQYDRYLQLLGQPMLVRSIALNVAGRTTETVVQSKDGTRLFLRGENMRGVWERTLVTTTTRATNTTTNDKENDGTTAPRINKNNNTLYVNNSDNETKIIVTADGERVTYEAWWEDEGRVHRSWLHGVQNYGGGSFESKRYLLRQVPSDQQQDDDDDEPSDNHDSWMNDAIYVCESTFHPRDTRREKAHLTWRFQRRRTRRIPPSSK
ncbi:hypothetical protein ACA910_020049 [Epithemia clementina (nom. ined.)]